METWQQLAVPGICERMIGFSVPQNDIVLIISYEGMHLLRLGTPVAVETDPEYSEYDLYDPVRGVARYRDGSGTSSACSLAGRTFPGVRANGWCWTPRPRRFR
jgi:hypothetical protein